MWGGVIILALDTALSACSVGVWHDGAMLASQSVIMPQGHAETLMPMIERVMGAANLNYGQLDRIAVTVGPGSFTGLRVGIATARGLAMATQKPAIGITTTEVFASMVSPHDHSTKNKYQILSVVDSRRDDAFAQVFDSNEQPLSEILNLTYESFHLRFPGPLMVVGDGAARAIKHLGNDAILSAASTACDVEVIAKIASTRAIDPRGPLPLYIRAPDVTLKSNGGALRP